MTNQNLKCHIMASFPIGVVDTPLKMYVLISNDYSIKMHVIILHPICIDTIKSISKYHGHSALASFSMCLICGLVFVDDFEEIPKEGRPPTEAELQQLFLPYRGFCARKGVSKQPFDCNTPRSFDLKGKSLYLIHDSVWINGEQSSHRQGLSIYFLHIGLFGKAATWTLKNFLTKYMMVSSQNQTEEIVLPLSVKKLSFWSLYNLHVIWHYLHCCTYHGISGPNMYLTSWTAWFQFIWIENIDFSLKVKCHTILKPSLLASIRLIDRTYFQIFLIAKWV